MPVLSFEVMDVAAWYAAMIDSIRNASEVVVGTRTKRYVRGMCWPGGAQPLSGEPENIAAPDLLVCAIFVHV